MTEFNYMGLDLIFYPKITGDRKYYFYMKYRSEFGFYDKSNCEVWGKPNKNNYLEILDSYIKSSLVRLATIKDNAEFINKNYKAVMRSVNELTIDELEELRSRWYYQHLDDGSLEEVVGVEVTSDYDIPMGFIKDYYEGTYFVEEDFWCNLK